MKFSDYFLSHGVRVVSTVFGIFVGAIVWVFGGWQYGVLVGAIVTLVTSVFLPVTLYLEDRPYIRIKESFKQPFLLDERVRFTLRQGTVGGFFVLTDERMILLSLEKGDHRLELSRGDVVSVVKSENMTISIFLNNKQYIRLISGVCEEICAVLRENGWNVTN